MNSFTKEYQALYDNLKLSVDEEAVSAILERLSQQYLQVLMKGFHEQETDQVMEATKQMAYVKTIMKKQLGEQNAACYMFFQAGLNAGQSRVGEAWLQEQGNEKSFERNMMVLCAKAHVKEIVKDIYENPGIQHGVLARMVGIRTNYLSQLAADLEEARCLRRFGTKKCTFYELTLAGKDYARKNFSEERNFPVKNYLRKRDREEELDRGRKGRGDIWKQSLVEDEEAVCRKVKEGIIDINVAREKYERSSRKTDKSYQQYRDAK